jgi:hypothetical protein
MFDHYELSHLHLLFGRPAAGTAPASASTGTACGRIDTRHQRRLATSLMLRYVHGTTALGIAVALGEIKMR